MSLANYSDFFLDVEFCSLGHLGYFSGVNGLGLLNLRHNVTSWTLFLLLVLCQMVRSMNSHDYIILYYNMLHCLVFRLHSY